MAWQRFRMKAVQSQAVAWRSSEEVCLAAFLVDQCPEVPKIQIVLIQLSFLTAVSLLSIIYDTCSMTCLMVQNGASYMYFAKILLAASTKHRDF